MSTFFTHLLAPFSRRRRKVTTNAVDINDNNNNASRSATLSPPQPESASIIVQTRTQQKQQQRPQESATVAFSDQPRTSIASSSSVNVESLEFKASQDLALSLDNWNDQAGVMPSFPAFEYLLHQQQEEQKEQKQQQQQQVPRRSLRRLPRPLSLYRSNNMKSLKMARSTPNFKQQQ